jgi:hypothetical protein
MAASDFRAGRFVAAAVVLGALGSACEFFVSFAIDGPRPVENEAGAETGPPVDAGFDPCGTDIPPRMAVPGNVDADAPRIVFAAYTWAIGGGPDLCAQAGLNLDGLNSATPECGDAGPCRRHEDIGGIAAGAACDFEGGVDNALSTLSATFVNATKGLALSPKDLDVLVGTGAVTMVMALDGYNQTDIDDDVTLNFFGAAHLDGVDAGERTDDELRALPRLWDGGQADAHWIVDENAVTSTGVAVLPLFVRHGYVSRSELVVDGVDARYFRLPHIASAGRATIQHGTLMGQLQHDDSGRWKLTKGRFTGAYASSGLLATLGAFRNGLATRYCNQESANTYAALRIYACGSLDLPADLSQPADPNALCGTMSMGFSFASIESQFLYDETGHQVIGPVFATEAPLCPDDAGTLWCDDCAWDGPRRCNDAGVEVDAAR